MGPHGKYTRTFLAEFINLYRCFPCLWRINSPHYRDRAHKNRAYAALLEKYREIDETADRTTVKRKINNLRTTHRKEMYKMEKANRTVGRKKYKSSIWYFELFEFLNCNDTAPKRKARTRDYYGQILRDWNSALAREADDTGKQLSDHEHGRSSTKDTETHKNSNPSEGDRGDPYAVFGQYVAAKLRDVDSEQLLLAKQLIGEVLLDARDRKLTIDSKLLSTQPNIKSEHITWNNGHTVQF